MNRELAGVGKDVQPAQQGAIRVLFVAHDTGTGGAQRTLLTLLSAIDRRVCSPLLVVPYEGPMSSAAAELGIPVFVERIVHWVPGWQVSSKRQYFTYFYRLILTLRSRSRAIEKLILDHNVDLVYTNTVTCVEGAIAARRSGKPHIWHIHEHILGNSELAPLFPYRLYCAAIGLLSRSIIFCSKTLATDYPKFSGKATVIYNGLPFPQLSDRIAARAKVTSAFSIDPVTKLIAVVAALHPRKDHLTFLAAAEQVARRFEKVLFLIVGAGSDSYTTLLRQRISELQLDSRVKLLGWRDDIYNLMAAIDVLVISSKQESFGLTAIEALAMETPVVATRCGGPEEIIEDGVTGLLVPVKDPRAMADAMQRLLLDQKLARCLGISGRKQVVERFGVHRYVQDIQGIIHEAVGFRSNR